MAGQLYFLTLMLTAKHLQMPFPVDQNVQTPFELVNSSLSSRAGAECLYKYKVTGEPTVVAVLNVTDVFDYESMLEEIAVIEGIQMVSQPLIWYQTFSRFLGVDDDSILARDDDSLKDDREVFWVNFDLKEYPAISTAELLKVWKNESIAALSARRDNGHMELFKVVNQRKIQVFLAAEPAVLDALSFGLPIMQEIGTGISTYTRKVQRLEDFCASMRSF